MAQEQIFLTILVLAYFSICWNEEFVAGSVPTFSLDYPFWPTDGYVVSNSTSVREGYITQPLDHFDPLNYNYWIQRYFWNDEFFQYEHPVFILLGNKSPINPIWLQQGLMMELCKELKGVAFFLEHRYFGESFPISNTELESLSYLTTEQVLGDIAAFIKYIKAKYDLQNSKIIVVGTSYAAALAVYMREDYPHLVDIAWTSSAALNKVYNFYEYFHEVGKVIYNISPECYGTVKVAFDDMEKLIWLGCNKTIIRRRPYYYTNSYYKSPDPETCELVQDLFNLCDPLDLNNEDDIRNFFQYMAQSFAYIVQFNSQRGIYSMENICSRIFQNTTLNKSPIEKLASFVDLFNTIIGFECIDFTQEEFCEQYQQTGMEETITNGHWNAPRQSFWLYCSQLGCLESSDNEVQPFGHSFPVQFLVRQCQCAFGQKFTETFIQNQVEKQFTRYGGTKKTFYTSRVLFVNGQFDPWKPLSVLFPSQTSCENEVVLIGGASQSYEMGPTSNTDTQAVIIARNQIAMTLTKWLIEVEAPCCPRENYYGYY